MQMTMPLDEGDRSVSFPPTGSLTTTVLQPSKRLQRVASCDSSQLTRESTLSLATSMGIASVVLLTATGLLLFATHTVVTEIVDAVIKLGDYPAIDLLYRLCGR